MSDIIVQPQSQANLPGMLYKPSELIAQFNAILSQQSINAKLVFLRGVYWKNPRQDAKWSACFDTLRDEDSQEELTLKITQKQREGLRDGSLVTVGGFLSRQVNSKGYIQLQLSVSRIEVVQDQVIDENEIKRMELRQRKALAGFKNVDAVLEQLLFTDVRPKIALVYATVSITDADFEAGSKAAQSAIDFHEFRVNFASSDALCSAMTDLDTKGFSALAIVRGGGGGLEHLDDLKVLEVVAGLKTPVIAAVGHVEEKVFLKQIVDKVSPTPTGLGSYFADMVEMVNQKKSQSLAVLTEKVRKQFKEQIETTNKQNESLQKQLGQVAKASEEAQKLHDKQIEEANKQNKTLQERLESMNKNLEASQKSHNEQMLALQGQLKAQIESAEKVRKEQQQLDAQKSQQFNESINKMQENNSRLQTALSHANEQNAASLKHAKELELKITELEAKRPEKAPLWMVIALVACLLIIVILLFK